MVKPNVLLRTGREILRTDGLVAFVKRGCAFAWSSLFEHQTYDLYAHYPANDHTLNETSFPAGLVGLRHEIVTTNEHADDLEAEGLEFRSKVNNARRRLNRGAIASCVFVGRELANIVWVAPTRRARNSLNQPHFEVDFAKKEVWVGDGWTNPKFRRRGLRVYGHLKGTQFLVQRGILVSRYAVAKGNIPSQMSTRKVDVHRYAEGHYVRILRWRFCKETASSMEAPGVPNSSTASRGC